MKEKANKSEEALTEKEVQALLARPEVAEAIFADEALCNEVIARFISELYAQKPAPTLRGKSALLPIPRPRSLEEAKKIVDNT